jgi:RNA polymerase sigma factor (sigma-70 family)
VQSSHYEYINGLVRLIQEFDDPDALAELVDYYEPLIKASIRKLCARSPEARPYQDDMMSEGPLIIRDIVNSYNPDLSYFSYFLSTRIDNAMQVLARKRYIGTPHGVEVVSIDDISEYQHSTHDPFAQILMRHVVREAVESLKGTQQEAIEMYFYRDMTQQEAAAELGITQASFSKRLQRGLKSLSILLADWE